MFLDQYWTHDEESSSGILSIAIMYFMDVFGLGLDSQLGLVKLMISITY